MVSDPVPGSSDGELIREEQDNADHSQDQGATGLERRSPDRHPQRSTLRTATTPPGTGGSRFRPTLKSGDGARCHRNRPAFQTVRVARVGGVTPCAVRSAAVPVWRPAFQAVCVVRVGGVTTCAARSAAVPVWRPAFQAVCVVRVGGVTTCAARSARGAGLETGVPIGFTAPIRAIFCCFAQWPIRREHLGVPSASQHLAWTCAPTDGRDGGPVRESAPPSAQYRRRQRRGRPAKPQQSTTLEGTRR